MRTAEERKLAHTAANPDPYTMFETLQAPTLDVGVSTTQLFSMIKEVPSRQVRASYSRALQDYLWFTMLHTSCTHIH